jgi:hypothetical protein
MMENWITHTGTLAIFREVSAKPIAVRQLTHLERQ